MPVSLTYGSPPRRLGPPLGNGPGRPLLRLSPASAGTTAPGPGTTARTAVHPASAGTTPRRGTRPPRTAVHPRIGGNHAAPDGAVTVMDGSPPHRRGPLLRVLLARPDRRFTPTSAGTTRCARSSANRNSVHRRVGGDHNTSRDVRLPATGSPPRRRGPRRGRPIPVLAHRLTPASARTTHFTDGDRTFLPVHPRVGGDHGHLVAHLVDYVGSPPRRRGPHPPVPDRGLWRRFTPASAGTTTGPSRTARSAVVHPRVGGDHYA